MKMCASTYGSNMIIKVEKLLEYDHYIALIDICMCNNKIVIVYYVLYIIIYSKVYNDKIKLH